MTENLQSSPPLAQSLVNYQLKTLMDYEWVLLALTLWREARGQSADAQLAIAHVICNRATDKLERWPKSIVSVITQQSQFTSIVPPQHITPAEMSNAVTWPKPSEPTSWTQFVQCCAIADQVGNAAEAKDPTLGANHYYSDPIPEVPAWADASKQTAHIGPFHFFKL